VLVDRRQERRFILETNSRKSVILAAETLPRRRPHGHPKSCTDKSRSRQALAADGRERRLGTADEKEGKEMSERDTEAIATR